MSELLGDDRMELEVQNVLDLALRALDMYGLEHTPYYVVMATMVVGDYCGCVWIANER